MIGDVRDVVVIGGGHNGVVCGAYLAKAGHDVVVIEARPTVGGCASTVDAIGARVNVCNCDHIMARASGVFEELDLAAHGLRYLDVDPHMLAIDHDGQTPWFGFYDVDRTLESLAVSYPNQVEAYRHYTRAAIPAARLLVDITRGCPTPGRVLTRLAAHRGKGASTILRWSRMSAEQVLRSFFSEEAIMTPSLAIAPGVWGLAPDSPGTGLGALTLAMRHVVQVGRPIGGSGAFTNAILAALEAAGGSVVCNARVCHIETANGRVSGVRLDDGRTITARAVVSSIDPRTTFTSLFDEVPSSLSRTVERWTGHTSPDGHQSKIDAVICSAPVYRHLESVDLDRIGVGDPLVPTAYISPSIAGIADAHRQASLGRVGSQPLFFANVPSALDPTMKSGDDHVLSLEAFFTPYELGGGWEDSPEPDRWLEMYGGLLQPGFLESVVRMRVVAPPDFERDFGMPRGYAPAYSGTLAGALAGRPRELARYITDLDGLYMSGAGTYPGAGIWGASGRNAASVVDRHLRANR